LNDRIAQIIGDITREVYTVKPISEQKRVSAAHRLCEKLHTWKASLPPLLGAVRPSSLIPSFRRQCIVLRIAYSHAIMHANRFFLLGKLSRKSEVQVAECVMAAKTVLEIVDSLARDSPIFHAFWWTHYVAFCALVVTYAWEIQQQIQYDDATATASTLPAQPVDRIVLLELAERCQTHLAQATATNSPSRRYAIILEELRSEAQRQSCVRGNVASSAGRHANDAAAVPEQRGPGVQHNLVIQGDPGAAAGQPYNNSVNHLGVHGFDPTMLEPAGDFASLSGNPVFEAWDMADWLELDSSVIRSPTLDIYMSISC